MPNPVTTQTAAPRADDLAADLLARRAAVVARGVPLGSSIVVRSAHGAVLIDYNGREIIDMAGGIGVMTAGHCHPDVVAAVREQVGVLQHTCIHVATYEPYVALCERLVELLPHGAHTKVMLVNSGAEAVENAIKIARQATGRQGVICFTGAFHGRTLLGMSLTSKVAYKAGSGPFAPEIYRLPFPDRFHDGDGLSEKAFVQRELTRLRESFVNLISPSTLAAILIEPILGEGGFIPAPVAYLQGLRALCDEHGIMLIFDEVQTGFCRTGAWGAYQRVGVTPNISAWAKAMGGGMPIACVVGEASIMDGAVPGTIGGTYGGNPVACASAIATLRVMEDLDLNARADVVGDYVRGRFGALRERSSLVADVRGLGAMVAVELCYDGDHARPAEKDTKQIIEACHARGVLVIGCGIHSNVIRVLCPLVITDAQLTHAMNIITEEIERISA